MTDSGALLKHAVTARRTPPLNRLFDAFAGRAGRLGFVGGIVRDWLLARWFDKDVDLVWDGDFDEIAAALTAAGIRARLRPAYLTATATIGELRVDLGATRRDHYPVPGGIPDVRPATLNDDLRRRDFTANAIAVFPDDATVTDPFAGVRDIASGLLRPVTRDTLTEDPVRLLRGARYLARFDWQPSGDWTHGLAQARRPATWRAVARGRIWREMELLSDEPDALDAWHWLDRLGILEALLGTALNGPVLRALRDARDRWPTPPPRRGTGRRWLLDLDALDTAAPGVLDWIRAHWDTPDDQLRRLARVRRRTRNGLPPFRV